MAQKKRVTGAAIRDSLGILGVVASLLFVGYEIRQNTIALKASAIQGSVNTARQQLQMLATNPELIRIAQRAEDDLSSLGPLERRQYLQVRLSFFWGMQGLYRQWVLGVLPNEEWHAWKRVICSNVLSVGEREQWRTNLRQTYIPDFAAEVESCPAFSEG